MGLTKEQIDKYLEDSSVCPYCGDGDITGGSVDVDTGGAGQKISCNNCDKQWVDCYDLTGIIELED
jgi:transcription elongation factor Elf1